MKYGKLILAAIIMAVIGYLVGPVIVNEVEAAYSARVATINMFAPTHSAQVYLYDRNDAIATTAYSTGIGTIAMFAATKDDTAYGGSATAISGTSVHPTTGWVTRKKCIDIETEGTWAGGSAVKGVRLVSVSPGNAVTLLVGYTAASAATIGNVLAHFTICGTGNGATAQEAWGQFSITNGATVLKANKRAAGAIRFDQASWLKVQWVSSTGTDKVAQKYARYWLNP